MRRWLGALALLGTVLGGSAPVRAHDLWLEPNAALAARSDELVLHLREGDAFKGDEERPLQKDHVERFDLFSDRARRRDLLAAGKDEQTPVARARLESGAGLVVMDRGPRLITMPPDKFNRYLADEGLDNIIAARAQLGETNQPGIEFYRRYLKTLIQERDPAATPSTLYKRRVGQWLEILLETDPGRMRPDSPLVVKVIFNDKPLVGARVFAFHRTGNEAPSTAMTATTSARGLAEFKVDQPGTWLVRLVHMNAALADRRTDAPAQWESFWAAYTFAVRITPPVATVPSPKDG